MNDWGFSVSTENIRTILIVFFIYSLLIVGLGLYVRISSKKMSDKDKITAYLSGNGNLGPISVGMIAVTNLLSAGALIGNAGMVYKNGLIYASCIIASLVCIWFLLGTIGKKLAIVKSRTGMQSIGALIRHRYNSKTLSVVISLILVLILIAALVSQLTGGAKMLAVLTGSSNYQWGLIILALVTIIYTASSGMESMAKVAVVQGFLMVCATFAMVIMSRGKFVETYGSFSAGMEVIASTTDLFKISNFTFWDTLSLTLSVGFASSVQPEGIISTFTYNNSKTLKRAILISLVIVPAILVPVLITPVFVKGFAASTVGGDYITPFVAGTVLPGWLGGVVLCGVSAALQSTCAAFMLVCASSLVKDIYHTAIKPDASEKQIAKMIPIATIIVGVITILLALNPVELLSIIDIFSNGASLCGLFGPIVIGIHSKRVTPKGAMWSAISGVGSYSLLYFLQHNTNTAVFYKKYMLNLPPTITGIVIAILALVVVSKFTPKVEKGIAQVWFGKDYNEDWAKIN